MRRAMEGRVGPETAPRIVRLLVAITCIASVSCSLLDAIAVHLFSLPPLSTLLFASWWGLSHLFLWQPFTYPFIYGGGEAITLFWLMGLAFYMYLLWTMGSHLVERMGEGEFLSLYLLSGALAASTALLFVPLLGQKMVFSGPAASILAVMTAWIMLNPRSKLLLFFIFPIEARWLLAATLGAIFLIHLSSFAIVPLLFYLTGPLFAYLFTAMRWKLYSPFPETHSFDRKLMELSDRLAIFRGGGRGSGKIFDIRTGESVDEEERFMDRMLEKISKKGSGSLTWWERQKMARISKRRKEK